MSNNQKILRIDRGKVIKPRKKEKKGLTALLVKNAGRGKHYDQNGLFLRVSNGSKHWLQRLVIHGRTREMGLGSYPLVSLREAREKAFQNRKIAKAGGDPLAIKRSPDIPTFTEAAEKFLEVRGPSYRNPRTPEIIRASLRRYTFPRLGRRRLDQIDAADVLTVLLAIWEKKPETARRVRQRIGAVMKWGIARGFRRDNPAGEAISAALPKTNGSAEHFRALNHSQVGTALETVKKSGAYIGTKLAFEFLVLTAARSGEVRGAQWGEIDFAKATWTIPAERMKGGQEHRVPLSGPALKVLAEAKINLSDGSGLVFPSVTGKTLSDSTLSKLLRENGVQAVPHGFRSSFRDWCAEVGIEREIAEVALAHISGRGSQVERAYFRSDLFSRRRELMESWGDYLTQGGNRNDG